MRIAVTGGMGFIGHEIVADLVRRGHEVFVVDFWKDLVKKYELAKLPIIDEIYDALPKCAGVYEPWEFVHGDMDSLGLNTVVHAGAVADTTDLGSDSLFMKNVDYTNILAKACSENGTDIVFISSAAVYGNNCHPNNPYGLTKALGETTMRNVEGISTVSLRLFNVFGKNEHHKGEMASVPWKIARTFERGGHFEMHSPSAQRDFVPSSTVVSVVGHLVEEICYSDHSWRRVYDVGTGIPMSFEKLVNEIALAKKYTGPNLVKIVEKPKHLEGRYQFYTCAGKHDVVNLGGNIGTDQGIREAYGVDK